MSRGKRKRRVERRDGGKPPVRPAAPPPGPAIFRSADPGQGFEQMMGAAKLADLMLAGCPFFEVRIDTATVRVIVDRPVGMRDETCRRCGRISTAFPGTCPGMISEGQALRMLLPPEALHATPEGPKLDLPESVSRNI